MGDLLLKPNLLTLSSYWFSGNSELQTLVDLGISGIEFRTTQPRLPWGFQSRRTVLASMTRRFLWRTDDAAIDQALFALYLDENPTLLEGLEDLGHNFWRAVADKPGRYFKFQPPSRTCPMSFYLRLALP